MAKKQSDPNHQRESARYIIPVPSREFILSHLNDIGEAQSFSDLISHFDLQLPEEREGLRRRLRAMIRDAELTQDKQDAYTAIHRDNLVKGYVQGHPDGFGFLIPEDGSPDVFLPFREMRRVFPLDRVLVHVTRNDRQKRDGIIVDIIESNTVTVVGQLYHDNGVYYVNPDDKRLAQDIVIPPNECLDAASGDYVLVDILSQPDRRHPPTGRIAQVFGDGCTQGLEMTLALHSHDIPHEWPAAAKSQSKKLGKTVKARDIEGRLDLRSTPFVTIDGVTAKDFDDAVFCAPRSGGGWRIYVAIADVAHYVPAGSALDLAAKERGNSVYFSAGVVPMLPESLSNGLCSLKPKVDRLAMVCEMLLDETGKVTRTRFHEAVIHSHARLTYDQVAEWLDHPDSADANILPHLQHLFSVYQLLNSHREARGAIAFETVETQVNFTESGRIASIVPVHRNVAHKIIEEFMLLTNEATANFIARSKLPSLFRVHEPPEQKKLLTLKQFLKLHGLRLTGGTEPTGMDYSRLLARIAPRKDAELLQTVLLRSMQQAIYWPNNLGHFGLAYQSYCHFTSPIRRYADLLIHRAIKHKLNQRKASDYPYTMDDMKQLSEHVSMTERRADLASRDALDWLKCDFIRHRLGDTFSAKITDVTSFGFFVSLSDIYVQGLVHISTLEGDYYHYDPAHFQLQGKRSGKIYQLGDLVTVQLSQVDVSARKIDFVLMDDKKQSARKAKKSKTTTSKSSLPGKKEKKGKKEKRSKKEKMSEKTKNKKKDLKATKSRRAGNRKTVKRT